MRAVHAGHDASVGCSLRVGIRATLQTDKLENCMRRIPALIAVLGFCRLRSRGADAGRLRRVEERAADPRSKNKDIRDDHRSERRRSRGRFISGFRRRRRAVGNPAQLTSFRSGTNWRHNFAASAMLSSKSWLPSSIRGPARWKSYFGDGEAVSCMRQSEGGRKRLLQPDVFNWPRSGPPGARHASTSRHFDDAGSSMFSS